MITRTSTIPNSRSELLGYLCRSFDGDEQEQPLRYLQDGDPLGLGSDWRPGSRCFVTNGSWIDGNVDSGLRACLADEFTSIHVVNLRGNQRTQGERSRREGGKVFGQGSRAPVAITVLVRNPGFCRYQGCRIRYHDIGDYLKREEKLALLSDARSIAGISDWRDIVVDRHHDWIHQRDEAFGNLYPMGSKAAKAGQTRPDDLSVVQQRLQNKARRLPL